MKRRILAFLCVLSILMGMIVMPAAAATAASAEATSYKVGYAKVDLNPFINTAVTAAVTGGLGIADQAYTDTEYVGKIKIQTSATTTAEVDFVKTPLSGYGTVSTRLANNLTDDNGDGIVGMGDGVFATATSVTDDWGNTVIYITMDTLNGNANLTKAVRSAITAELGIKGNQIMITGSHSHEAPDPYALYNSWNNNMNTANTNATGNVTALGTYWLYMIDRLTEAAVTAYNNATEATMSKGSVEAPTAMAAMGYKYSDGTGMKLNFVRNYKATQVIESVPMRKPLLGSWTQNGDPTVTGTAVFYIGDNFGSASEGTVTTQGTASGFLTQTRTDTRTTTTLEHGTEGNQSMNLLQFTPTNGDKPIVMVEWRAHASNNGHSYFTNLSSDYVNALRYRLENNATLFHGDTDYFVGFWQGASGNNNAGSRIKTEYAYNSATDPTKNTGYPSVFLDDIQSGVNDVKVNNDKTGFYADYYTSVTQGSAYSYEFYRSAHYGYILGKVALYGLDNCMTEVTDYSEIRAVQNNYTSERRTWPDGYFEAAYEAIKTKGLTTNTGYPYAAANGIVLNSFYHANAILEDYTYTVANGAVISKTPKTSGTNVELNAIMMGNQVALVTGTGELYDNYNSNPETDPTYNKWVELIGQTYGTPFTLSYSNHSTGYAPNVLAYDFPTNAAGTAVGSYEANTTDHARGTGEAIIDEYLRMLAIIEKGPAVYKCQHCGEDAEWTPLFKGDANVDLASGHYYMVEDLVGTGQNGQQVLGASDGTAAVDVCLDLNGYTYTSETRCAIVYKNSTLSIMNMVGVDGDGNPVENKNSGTTGEMIGHSYSNNPGGGAFSVSSGATVNLYGGTLKFVKLDNPDWYGTGQGGTFYLSGTLNMFDGTIVGGDMVKGTYSDAYIGLGGAVYLNSGGTLNMSGGSITSGTVPEGGMGPCVYLVSQTTSRVNLSGNASIEDIYYRYNGGAQVTVSGTYTGTVGLSFHPDIALQQNLDIGNVKSGTNISGATFTCTDTTNEWTAGIIGANLVLKGFSDNVGAVIISGSTQSEYETLADAVKAYSTGYIKLIKDDSSNVSITKDVYLDLNGCDATGAITVSSGTLYGMDSMTDDYTVNDAYGYGKLTKATGNIKPVPVESTVTEDGYLMVTETAGKSFHRVNLKITDMTLRQRNDEDPEDVYNPGVYYKATNSFSADEIAAARIQKFGVAMSAIEVPTEANLNEKCGYSWYTGFKAGKDANSASGTLLSGVLKETNPNLINKRNANTVVYGRAYILTEDGYLFGDCVQRSFREQVEGVDKIWSTLAKEQKELTIAMYQTYSGIMSSWDIPNILEELQSDEYQTLKVLVVGNSHGLDATNLLYEVFKTEAPEQKVVIGALYYSGCNMNQHANYMKTDSAAYDYYKNGNYEGANADGSWQIVEKTTAAYGLGDEQWDIVVMQQMNHRAAYESSTENNFYKTNYQYVVNYINDHVKNGVKPELAWHMVWTNPDQEEYLSGSLRHPVTPDEWTATHASWFPGADGKYDQSAMYQGIVDCLKAYIIDADNNFLGKNTFKYILPSALAVEYAQDVLGCSQAQLYRDYTHMNDYGRLMTAYAWYAELMGMDKIPAVNVGEIPAVLHHSKSTILETNEAGNYVVTDDMKKIIRKAVNFALENPYDYELPAEEDNTVSILGIGNSYTIDSMWMLGEVYQAENPGKNVQLGIAYKSGETLAGHVTNINAGDEGTVYDYLYWDSASDKWTVSSEKMTLEQILAAQDWEMVSMQQGSGGSGVPSTYNSNIDYIQNYVIDQLGYAPTFLWNATWAYPEADIQGDAYDNTNRPNAGSFNTYYGNSQATMYKAIMSAVREKILPNATFDYLMPVGTAIQNANGTLTDHELYRDYTHLSDLSRLMAAYTWYCELELVTLDDIQLKALPTVNCSSKSWYNGTARNLTSSELSLVIESVKDAMKDNFTTTDESV